MIRFKKYLKTCLIAVLDCNLNFALSKRIEKDYTLYILSYNGVNYRYRVSPSEMDIIYDKYGNNIPNYLSCRVTLWYVEGLKPKQGSHMELLWCFAYNAISGLLRDISYEGVSLVDNGKRYGNIRDYFIDNRKELYVSFRKPLSISLR